VMFGTNFARRCLPELLDDATRATPWGSFWFRKVR
jgi:hypothetical protein